MTTNWTPNAQDIEITKFLLDGMYVKSAAEEYECSQYSINHSMDKVLMRVIRRRKGERGSGDYGRWFNDVSVEGYDKYYGKRNLHNYRKDKTWWVDRIESHDFAVEHQEVEPIQRLCRYCDRPNTSNSSCCSLRCERGLQAIIDYTPDLGPEKRNNIFIRIYARIFGSLYG